MPLRGKPARTEDSPSESPSSTTSRRRTKTGRKRRAASSSKRSSRPSDRLEHTAEKTSLPRPDCDRMNATAQSPDIGERTANSFKLDGHSKQASHHTLNKPPILSTSQLQTFCFQPIVCKQPSSTKKKKLLSDSKEDLRFKKPTSSGSPKKKLTLIQKILVGGSREKQKPSSPPPEANAGRQSSKDANKQPGLKSLHEYDITRLRKQVPTVNHLRQKIK